MKKSREILLHFIFWVFYIVNSVLTYEINFLNQCGYFDIGVKQFVIHLAILVVFYVNYLFLIPRFLSKRKYFIYIFCCILLFGVRLVISYLNSHFLDWYLHTEGFFVKNLMEQIPYTVFQTFFYLLISTGARFTRDWFASQGLRDEIERNKLDSELAMLKYQINPHFLFNTLNNIYSLINSKSDKAGEALMMLSQIMRYALKENASDSIALEKELDYMVDFINLQKIRLPRPEIVRYQLKGDPSGFQIVPYILIPFVENAFKHGNTTSYTAEIKIKINITDGKLVMKIHNQKAKKAVDEQSGIGIKNVRRRLEILYPKKHSLSINESETDYFAELELDLQ